MLVQQVDQVNDKESHKKVATLAILQGMWFKFKSPKNLVKTDSILG